MFKFSAFIFIVSIIIGCGNSIAQSTGLSLKTNSHQTGNKKIQNLLIVGGGNTVTRIFLDDVAHEISKALLAADIKTSRLFFEEQSQLDTVNYDNYDAFLIFSSDSVNWSNKLKDKTWTMPFRKRGLVSGYTPNLKASSKMQGTFSLYLFQEMEDVLDIIWEGDLTVSMDMAKNKRYKKVANLIYTELRKKKVIVY